jgi:hypothetical protein
MARAGKVTSRYSVLPYRVLLRALSKIAYPQWFARKLAVVSWHLKKYFEIPGSALEAFRKDVASYPAVRPPSTV